MENAKKRKYGAIVADLCECLQIEWSSFMSGSSDISDTNEEIERLTSRLNAAKYKLQVQKEWYHDNWEPTFKRIMKFSTEIQHKVKIICRVRAAREDDTEAFSSNGNDIKFSHDGEDYSFIFDKVFAQTAPLAEVYLRISQNVLHVLDGHHTCIFACGGYESGKTYSMMGKPGNVAEKGLIQHGIEELFEEFKNHETFQTRKYKVQVSMLEVYRGKIWDLLSSSNESSTVSTKDQQYAIQKDPNGNIDMSGLTMIHLPDYEKISDLLVIASKKRYRQSKRNNCKRSSKSDLVFTIKVLIVNEENMEEQVHGVLNFVDMASSEVKPGKTSRSLRALQDVMLAFARKEPPPFENSTLTHLLQPSLGGDSKSVIILNMYPTPSPSLISLLRPWSELRRMRYYLR